MKYLVNHNGKETDLIIKRTGLFKPQELWLGDEMIGHWPKQSQMRDGHKITTKDNAVLEFKMKTYPPELHMHFNGVPVKGTSAHPETVVNVAYTVMMLICGLNIFMGLLVTILKYQILLNLGFGVYNLFVGGIHAILLFIGYKEKKLWPLAFGLGVFILDAIMMAYNMTLLRMFQPGPIIMRVFFIIPWFKGCYTLFKSKTAKANSK